MKILKLKKWCYYNIIIPGIGIISNDFNDTGPTCHLPAAPGPDKPEWYLSTPLLILYIISLVIFIIFGIFILQKHFRKQRNLNNLYKNGIISKDEYKSLKGDK